MMNHSFRNVDAFSAAQGKADAEIPVFPVEHIVFIEASDSECILPSDKHGSPRNGIEDFEFGP